MREICLSGSEGRGTEANRISLPLSYFGAPFFYPLDLVSFGLPLNIIRGTGFGIMNETSGTSRRIHFTRASTLPG